MNMETSPLKALYGPALSRDAKQAESHYRSKNVKAKNVVPHCIAALDEGIMGGIINPKANRRTNHVSCNVHLLTLYHLFLKRKHLPENVASRIAEPIKVGKDAIDGSFGLFNIGRDLMYDGRAKELASLFDDQRIPMRMRLEVLLAHMADAMTLHSPETMAALPYGSLKTVNDGHEQMLANPTDWETQVPLMAQAMSKVLCPAADLFGLSYVYRKIRDTSAQHIHPGIYSEVAVELVKLQGAILKTNRMVEEIFRKMKEACETKGIKMRILRRNQDDSRSHEPGEDEHKSRGSITDKLAKKRANGENEKVRDLHDIVARMLITETLEDLRFVTGFLLKKAIPHTLRVYGMPGAVIEPTDYVSTPKKRAGSQSYQTGYQSFHIDTLVDERSFLNFEFIVRTEEMHEYADKGGAAHHIYKDGVLQNGLLLEFRKMLSVIMQNGKGRK